MASNMIIGTWMSYMGILLYVVIQQNNPSLCYQEWHLIPKLATVEPLYVTDTLESVNFDVILL